jgi:low affinity Fe/Cu permease
MIILSGDQPMSRPLNLFDRIAKSAEYMTGHPVAFCIALTLIAAWAMTGPAFHYSDSWQLVINTATTVVTFLMVFVIQNNQNRASAAIQLKLDELIRSMSGAHNALLTLEDLTLEDIEQFRSHYEKLARAARARLKQGGADTDTPDILIG